MKSGILLLARTSSTRLPGKLLLELMGRPILEYQIERLKTALRPQCIVLCTTPLSEDDALVDLAGRSSVLTFRGSIEDVVERMLQAARQYQLNFIVSIGGDDILSDPVCVDRVIECFEQTGADFIYCPDLPMGTSPYGVKATALEHLFEVKAGDTDGWERYFQETQFFRVERIPAERQVLRRPELRMTLDYLEDFEFFKAVFEALYPRKPIFSLEDVITLIDRRPDIAALGQKRAGEWYSKRATFNIAVRPGASRNPEGNV